MPIYEYQCQACEERLETIQSISAPPLTTCPECGGDLKKLLSAPAFRFKGSGWYVTDYGRSGNGSKTEGEKSAEPGSKGESGGGEDKGSDKGADKGSGDRSAKPAAGDKAAKGSAS